MPRKLLAALTAALIFLSPAAALAETVVTSFYPIYLFTLNLTWDIPEISVHNLAAPGTGCLHDYQLQTRDMKQLAQADAFLICGAGMESFLPGVQEAFPELPVVDASQGIELLPLGDEGVQIGQQESLWNAHVWLDAANAQQMVRNLAQGLISALPHQAQAIEANRDQYLLRLQSLDEELRAGLADLPRRDIITFHEAFPYFARAYGLNVAAVVSREPGDALSPAYLAELVDVVKDLGTPPLFTEPQYEDMAARTLAAETGAAVYSLDPVVTGPEEDVPLSYYEDVMRQNMATLREALGGE